jgi:hypothetical protein
MNITYKNINSLRGIARKPYCEHAYLTYVNDFFDFSELFRMDTSHGKRSIANN